MLRAAAAVRTLDDRDVAEALRLLDVDPVADCMVAARVRTAGLDPVRLGAEVWGHTGPDGRVDALCWSGANLVPVQADLAAARAFGERARRQGRRCSSLVGPVEAAGEMWRVLRPSWGPARDVRACQPLLAISRDPLTAPHPGVRPVRPDEVDLLLPACIAMYTEEVGVSPVTGDGRGLYRARVAESVAAGRAFALVEDGQVVYKAEVASATPQVAQVQGVWVHPERRRCGLGAAGTAAVVALARRRLAPTVSLYVNDYNTAARAAYDRVGFRQVGTFMSVLF